MGHSIRKVRKPWSREIEMALVAFIIALHVPNSNRFHSYLGYEKETGVLTNCLYFWFGSGWLTLP